MSTSLVDASTKKDDIMFFFLFLSKTINEMVLNLLQISTNLVIYGRVRQHACALQTQFVEFCQFKLHNNSSVSRQKGYLSIIPPWIHKLQTMILKHDAWGGHENMGNDFQGKL